MSLDFSPDFRFLVSGGCDGQLVFWHLDSNQVFRKFSASDGADSKPFVVYDV